MASLLLRNAALLNVDTGAYEEADLLCHAGRIVETGPSLRALDDTVILQLNGAVVLPGLIDAHVHVTSATADLAALATWSPALVTAHAAKIMRGMLARGFTTVRDASGADSGLASAQEQGLLPGPRINFAGRALSQTGGHGDVRPAGVTAMDDRSCCLGADVVADGVDAVRLAARHELRKGADFLKVMAGGGVASPTDRIDATQYSMAELTAVVEEAEAANRYVAAHAYTPRAVSRALEAGVRSIEHGNLIDDTNVAQLLDHEAFLVPTLVTYWALHREGERFGLPAASAAKVDEVLNAGLSALERAHRAGVKVVFGTDLLGGMHPHQSREFLLRREVQQPLDIIKSATVTAADLLRRTGDLGTLAVGAVADLLVLNADPLLDIAVLTLKHQIRYVVQGGTVVHTGNPDRSALAA